MNQSVRTSASQPLRRLLAMALSILLIFSLMPTAQADPATPLQAEVISATGNGGSSVSVAVYMEPGLSNYDDAFWEYALSLSYDSSVLTLTDPVVDEADSETFNANTSNAGSIVVEAYSFGDFHFIMERQKLFTLNFIINKDAAPGDSLITLDSGTFTLDVEPENISALNSGKVTIVNAAPTASDVAIGGTPSVGSTLTGSYAYADSEGNAEGVSAFQWYAADDASGTNRTAIEGAVSNTLVLSEAQFGKYILFEVTPAAAGGMVTGIAALSPAAGPVTAVANTAEVKIGAVSGVRNGTVAVPVSLTASSAGVGSYGMRIEFDKTALEVASITGPSGDIFSSIYSNADGWLQAAWADASGGDHAIEAGQELFLISFKVKADAADGIKALTIADAGVIEQFTLTDASAVEMDKTLVPGQVNVYTPSSPVADADQEIITVDVQDAGSEGGDIVSKARIERTKKADGTKSDKVSLTSEQAKQIVDSILAAKSTMAHILIPDDKDEVSEVNVTVPVSSSKLIADARISLGLVTDNVKVIIPSESLQGFDDELYFRFIPIKSEAEKLEVISRANRNDLVKAAAGDKDAALIGRPMTIETNLQNRKVTLVMPLKGLQLSQNELENLAVYVEHSDGTKELLYGTLVAYGGNEGAQGLEFTVNKFSTFTLVQMEGNTKVHNAYMKGYTDGTFRPDKQITRAEIAAILSRVTTTSEEGEAIAYRDVAASHWAAGAIAGVAAMKLMNGYEDGTFRPEKSITRGEMASLVSKLIDGDAIGAGFTDIAGHWAEEAILKVQEAGIIQGYEDGGFRPDQPLTRAEAVAILNKTLGRRSADSVVSSPWSDVETSYWAYKDIVEASVDHAYTVDADGEERWKR